MNFIRQIERMQLLNKLIREQRTGSPEELAKRLGVSRRQLYAYLEYLKDFGLDICFSRKLNSFMYCDEQEIKIDLKIQVLKPSESRRIMGGWAFRLIA
ncbi:HTH domain-containing protein [Shivajiella indica]|uniref:HTH domain-containing protein n=1 Tax=Shivajiella indica TaxID=872115 RepID=A0ABW5B415_9BACT